MMDLVVDKIRNNFYVNAENKCCIDYYESKESILEQMDRETFESKFVVRVPGGIDNLNYPVITFQFYSNGREAGTFFDKNCTYDEIYTGAKDYFDKK